jgi:hypothetical protein
MHLFLYKLLQQEGSPEGNKKSLLAKGLIDFRHKRWLLQLSWKCTDGFHGQRSFKGLDGFVLLVRSDVSEKKRS